jgi:NADH:ubiquinone oxidoreductase subunit 6 (subunit J)
MEKKGNVTTDQIDMSLGLTRKFFLPFSIAFLLFGTAIIGAIASLIGAGIAKKNPISPFENAS